MYFTEYEKELSADIDSHVHSSSEFKKLLNAILMVSKLKIRFPTPLQSVLVPIINYTVCCKWDRDTDTMAYQIQIKH